jgi:hypothetical protein
MKYQYEISIKSVSVRMWRDKVKGILLFIFSSYKEYHLFNNI